MIHRARLLFVCAVVLAAVIVGAEFPLGQLLHERQVVAATSSQLQKLQSQNRWLSGQIAQLHQPATVGRIAHEQYGLVQKGESSVVVLPSAGDGGGSDPLSTTHIPSSDLVPSDSLPATPQTGTSTGPPQQGFFSRLIQRLEFWKASS